MKIKVKQLRDFLKYSSLIKTHTIIPTLKYLKIENGNISKSNLAISCSMDIECDKTESYLVDEDRLKQFLSKCASIDMDISIKDGKVILFDGKTRYNHKVENIGDYPRFQYEPEQKGTLITTPIIETIDIARSFVSGDDSATNFRCVHFKDNYIYAISGGLFYVKKFKWKFPEVLLLDEYCDILTQFKSGFFSQTEHHYFYDFDFIKFAFTKLEYKSPDIESMMPMLNGLEAEPAFKIIKKELIDFCEMANGSTPNKSVYCSFVFDTELMSPVIKFEDNDYSVGSKTEIFVDGEIQPFDFNSRIHLNPLKALTQESFECVVKKNTLVIRNSDSFACFSGVALNQSYGDNQV